MHPTFGLWLLISIVQANFVCTVSTSVSSILTGSILSNAHTIRADGGSLKAKYLDEQLLLHKKPKVRFRVWMSVKGKGSSRKAIEFGDVFLDPNCTCREVKHALAFVTNCPVSAMDVVIRDSDDEEVCNLGLRGELLKDHWAHPGGCLHVIQELPVTSVGWLEV